jgi:GH15 family glucan-1,4-alpha-glucosidase
VSGVPYPAIGQLAAIGDRRTAALVGPDGTMGWLCLPRFDAAAIFGSLLDVDRGGWWRFGPARPALGRQRYVDDTAVAITEWELAEGDLELHDLMGLSGSRPNDDSQIVVRRLRCTRGAVRCRMEFHPRIDFGQAPELTADLTGNIPGAGPFRLWCTFPVDGDGRSAEADLDLRQGEELWAVLDVGSDGRPWSIEHARRVTEDTIAEWQAWAARLRYQGPRRASVVRAAITIRLLSYAPIGSPVAAATTSLPERIGGTWNADYRLSWVRDASLCLSVLARLGDLDAARRYVDWLARLRSHSGPPLQVLYRVDGSRCAEPTEREDLEGYRGSRPVRFGNHAFQQCQLDAFGFLADCLVEYLDHGGDWDERWWPLLESVTSYLATCWQSPGNGIWELSRPACFVSSRVMSWVALARIGEVARRTGRTQQAERCKALSAEIHAEVLARGYSERMASFRQRYDADNLDAAALLIPVTGFLRPDNNRVLSTIDCIARDLTTDDFVYRFDPALTPGTEGRLGEFEAAFIPCTMWMAHARALTGRMDLATALLDRVESMAGPMGLMAEAVDPRDCTWRGNTPLLFSHATYVLAALAVDQESNPSQRGASADGSRPPGAG